MSSFCSLVAVGYDTNIWFRFKKYYGTLYGYSRLAFNKYSTYLLLSFPFRWKTTDCSSQTSGTGVPSGI